MAKPKIKKMFEGFLAKKVPPVFSRAMDKKSKAQGATDTIRALVSSVHLLLHFFTGNSILLFDALEQMDEEMHLLRRMMVHSIKL